MERINKVVPKWRQIYYKWRSLRNVPFRKRFFVGYDLNGSTYWEFYPEGTSKYRARRIWEPNGKQQFMVDYYDKLPVQWMQWLRYTRMRAPTPEELVADEKRIADLQARVKAKEAELEYKQAASDHFIAKNMYKELDKIEASKTQPEKPASKEKPGQRLVH